MTDMIRFMLCPDGLYSISDGDEVIARHLTGELVREILRDLAKAGWRVKSEKAGAA